MKILCTGDWQARLSNLDQCEQVVAECVEIIQWRKVDFIVHLGDLGDQFNPRDVRVTNFLVYAVQKLRSATKDNLFLSLLGNHDRSGPQDHLPSIFPVLRSAGAITFEEPKHYVLGSGWNAYFVPYIRDQEKLKQALADFKVVKGKQQILFFHAGLRGSKLSVIRKDTESLENKHFHPEHYAHCIGGHHHFQQKIAPNFWYCGSPMPQDWGEANQKKGYLLLELGNFGSSITPIPSKLPLWYDPDLPEFDPTANKQPCRIRLRIPFESPKQYAADCKHAQEKYFRAKLTIIPTYKDKESPVAGNVNLKSDADLIRSFLKHNPTLITEPEVAVAYLVARLKASGTGDVFQLRELKLQSCHAENVLGFEKVDFKIDYPGLTLVTGDNKDWPGHSNGAGKSGMLSLPVIALFGETPKGQVFNEWVRRGQKKALCHLTAEVDGKKVLIDRYRPSGLRLTVDGKSFDMGDWRATQRLIDQLTGLTWGVLTNSLYVTQNEIGTLLTGTDKERQNLFSRFLGLERFIKALELVRRDHIRVARHIEEVEVLIRDCTEHIASQTQMLSKVDLSGAVTRKEYFKQSDKIKSAIEEAYQYQREGELANKNWATKLTEYESKAYALAHKITEVETKITGLDEGLKAIQDLQSQTNCPTCGAVVDKASLSHHIAETKKQIQELQKRSGALEVSKATATLKLKSIRAKIDYYDSFLLNRKLDKERLRAEFSALQDKRRQSQQLEAVHNAGQQEITLWQHRLKIHEECIEVLREDNKFLEGCIAVVARDGLPAFLCATACPRLNASATEFSEALAESEIQVQFAVVDGAIDVHIINAHGGEGVGDQSRGELQIAALITSFSLRDALVPFDAIILDEPTEGLDPENAKNFARALNQLKKRFGSVLIVTHNTNTLAELEPDRHLIVTKENGIATVTEQK